MIMLIAMLIIIYCSLMSTVGAMLAAMLALNLVQQALVVRSYWNLKMEIKSSALPRIANEIEIPSS